MKQEVSKDSPLVSIIMNCFNGERYLKDSIESIINQTYKNWELIFWDNKSEDESAKIFKSYNDKRLKYFMADKHTSLYKARNLAIKESTGEFISFLDTDDVWDEKKIELQIKCFKDEKVGLVFSNFWLIKKKMKKKKLGIKQKLPSGYIYNEILRNYTVGILTVIIKKSYYLKLESNFDERFSFVGDFDLFLRLAKICKFESIQTPLAYYRLHGKNLTTINKEKEVEEYDMWLRENRSNLNETDIKSIFKHFNYRKFVNFKIDGNYNKCLEILFNLKNNQLNIKNIIILFTPIFILKKFMWYHQD